ncbi:MAG TPA: glycosyltransferase family 2 protein [Paludibacter sp.]
MISPLISVIVPVYNVETYLTKTIESCLAQSLFNIEVILINDGSPDSSASIIDKFAALDNRVVAIHNKNEGVTLARKKGLEIARGEFIFYLDGDDYLTYDALEALYYEAKKKNADFVVGDFIVEYPDGRLIEKKFNDFKEVNNIEFLRYCFSEGDFYFTGRLIRRDFLSKINLNIPSSITFGEDNIAIVQLAFNLNKACKINKFILYYVQRDDSVTNKLEKKDLIARSNACNFVIDFARNKQFYTQLKQEIELFALREIYAGVVRGNIDKTLASEYLKLPLNSDPYLMGNLDYKVRLFLTIASINKYFALIFMQFVKRIKKLY